MVVPGSRRTSKVSPGTSEEWRRHGSDRSPTCPEGTAASGSPGLLMDNYAFLVMFNGNFNGDFNGIYIGFILGLYWIYMDLYEFIWIYIGLMVI